MLFELSIRGLVQGVGFRPFIYLLATEMNIRGTVANRNDGLIIRMTCNEKDKDIFVRRICRECPQAASVHEIEVEVSDSEEEFVGFSIIRSESESEEVTLVAPDISVCPDCMADRELQRHRINYPFVNCTHCGPRFSIIKDLPYDREHTTMSSFVMCSDCQKEYIDITDRRFHAQPVACNNCGPSYYADYGQDRLIDYNKLLSLTSNILNEGGVIAAKGMGGYHLICDATSEAAVDRLRKIKMRDSKPFAVMFRNLEQIKDYAFVNDREAECLTSWKKPIVLLRQKKPLAAGVNEGMNTIGCMLPYMPIHYDWFERVNTSALVMTSGNISDTPIIISPKEAELELGDKVDLVLHHNREIYNRIDDSVLYVCNDQASLIRRARGYVPEPFFADIETEGILAFGAEKVNTFSLGKKDTIIQSQYIGDLKNTETYNFYTESLHRFCRLFRFTPSVLVCDLHPDYLSSVEAEQFAKDKGLSLLKVQHHHAHAAACMLEHNIHEPVVAVVWDGTGLGDDNKAWGGEFFLCDRNQYERLSHFDYVPMPGGDKVVDEPWRMAVSYVHHYGLKLPQAFVERIGQSKIDMLVNMLDKNINSPYTSSAGRLFDALASLIGVCDFATRQAEAPVLLEQCAERDYSFRYLIDAQRTQISVCSFLQGVLNDIEKGISVNMISTKIHNGLAHLILEKSRLLLKQTNARKVVLSGGCFQNKRLVEYLQVLFAKNEIPLYIPSKIPCSDSGISVGQLAVAAARRQSQ